MRFARLYRSLPLGLLVLVPGALAQAQAQSAVPLPVPSAMLLNASTAPASSTNPGCKRYDSTDPSDSTHECNVTVSLTGSLGSMGYALAMPSTTAAVSDTNTAEGVNEKYNFPSVYLYISASPNLYPDPKQENQNAEIKSVKNESIDLKWMRAEFTIVPLDKDGNPLPDSLPKGEVPYVQILGLSPSATLAASKTPLANTVATAGNQLMTAAAPFFPGVGDVAEAATSSLQVLFSNLFPPKADAYQYAWIDGQREFGWYFKQDVNAGTPVSVLGLQTGLVLLRTSKKVKSITIQGKVISQWTDRPLEKQKSDYLLTTKDVKVPIPETSYDALQDLNPFPLLIPDRTVKKILLIDEKGKQTGDKGTSCVNSPPLDSKCSDWQKLVCGTPPVLVTVDEAHKWVLKGSLQSYLTSGPPSGATPPSSCAP